MPGLGSLSRYLVSFAPQWGLGCLHLGVAPGSLPALPQGTGVPAQGATQSREGEEQVVVLKGFLFCWRGGGFSWGGEMGNGWWWCAGGGGGVGGGGVVVY